MTTPPDPSSRLRLALFTDTFAPQLNGVSRTLERLVTAVRARGGEAQVWTPADPARPPREALIDHPSGAFWAYPELRLAAPQPWRAVRELRAFAPTLVHAATPFGVGLAGRFAAAALRLPLVTSYHTSLTAYASFYGLAGLTRPGWWFLRWFHNGGQRTYCPTHAVQRELRGRGLRRTRLWSRGVDTAAFHPAHRCPDLRRRLGAGPDDLLVVYVGRLAREKGLETALQAMAEAPRRTSHRLVLALAGEGPFAEACRAQAPAGTRLVGRLDGAALGAFYASADLFVFPSSTDTFGNVLLEAMASRLAVVAADAPPTRELLAHGELGELVPAGDPAALAAAVAGLADQPDRRQRLAARGRAAALSRSWDAVFDALFEDYVVVCDRHRRRGGGELAAFGRLPRLARPAGAAGRQHPAGLRQAG